MLKLPPLFNQLPLNPLRLPPPSMGVRALRWPLLPPMPS